MRKCNCGAENPDDAKFCRGCGKEFVNSSIEWVDTSLVKITLTTGQKVGNFFTSIGLLIISFFLLMGILGLIMNFTELEFADSDSKVFFLVTLAVIFFIIWLSIVIRLCSYGKRKTKALRRVASAIESSGTGDLYITKADKYGLYDWEKKKVLVPVIYDSFNPTDGFYYIVSKGNKYGIYSRPLNRLIVRCEYDAITPFVHNRATITKGNVTKQVDTQGNIF